MNGNHLTTAGLHTIVLGMIWNKCDSSAAALSFGFRIQISTERNIPLIEYS